METIRKNIYENWITVDKYILNFYYALDFMNKPCPPVAYSLVGESEGQSTNHFKHCRSQCSCVL